MAAVAMEDLSLSQPAEMQNANLELDDLELAYKMQLHEALLASSQIAAQKGVPAGTDEYTEQVLSLEVETQGQQEALKLQEEEIERARQQAAWDQATVVAKREAAVQYQCEKADAKFARYLADISDDEWEDYGDTYNIDSLPPHERKFPDQVQLRCLGLTGEDCVGAGAILLLGNDQILELCPQLESIHTACTAELQVIIEGLKAARAFGIQRPLLAISPFVQLKLSGSVGPLDAGEITLVVAVQALVAELGAYVKAVPVDRNRRALRLARKSAAKYVDPARAAAARAAAAPRAQPARETPPASTPNASQESCTICLEAHPPADMFSLAACSHRFCKACVGQHATVRTRSRSLPVPCPHPGCDRELSPTDCEAVLPAEVFTLLLDVQAENCIPGEERVYCPYKGCSAMMSRGEWGDEDRPMSSAHPHRTAVGRVTCVDCQRLFCLECQVPWHHGMSCRDYQDLPPDQRAVEDVKLHTLAATKQWKQCPGCRRMIELAEGCNHMTCVCEAEFCYVCAAPWRGGRATCDCPLFDDVAEENAVAVRNDYEEDRRRRLGRMYKTQMCVHFLRGYCRNGQWCRYAHGQHELRYPEDNMY